MTTLASYPVPGNTLYVFFLSFPLSSGFLSLPYFIFLLAASPFLPTSPLPPPSSQGFVQLVDKTYAVAYVLTTYKNIQVRS